MDTKTIEILERNVRHLSRQTEQETRMMPQTEASLPSVEQVKKITDFIGKNYQPGKEHHLS